jgi:hypothetical protein
MFPYYGFDPTFLLLIPALLLAGYAQWKVSSAFNRFSQVATSGGRTGAEIAAEILKRRGVRDVTIEQVDGMLSDHYDPRSKTLRLSPAVYGSNSVAAVGVAAHECGHALQDKERYPALALRSAIVPVANIGTSAAWILFFIGMLTQRGILMDLGILLFLGYVVFALVTLPVEFDASSRAVAVLQGEGLVMPSEADGVKTVLNAAALTYIAGFVAALGQLIYFFALSRQ